MLTVLVENADRDSVQLLSCIDWKETSLPTSSAGSAEIIYIVKKGYVRAAGSSSYRRGYRRTEPTSSLSSLLENGRSMSGLIPRQSLI